MFDRFVAPNVYGELIRSLELEDGGIFPRGGVGREGKRVYVCVCA